MSSGAKEFLKITAVSVFRGIVMGVTIAICLHIWG